MHRFGIIHQGDEGDPWFVQPDARAAMAGMFRNGGGVPTYAAPLIVQGNVPVYVTIYGTGGNFTSLRVDIPG